MAEFVVDRFISRSRRKNHLETNVYCKNFFSSRWRSKPRHCQETISNIKIRQYKERIANLKIRHYRGRGACRDFYLKLRYSVVQRRVIWGSMTIL
jgi:hypothetical protein